MFFKPLRSFSHTNINFCQLTKCATSHIITLTSVCLFPFTTQACLRFSVWPRLFPTLKQKAEPPARTLLLRAGSLGLQHWNPWKPVRNAEPQALSQTHWNRSCISIRFLDDVLCTLNSVTQGSSFYCGMERATKSTITALTGKLSQTKFKFMTYFEPNP